MRCYLCQRPAARIGDDYPRVAIRHPFALLSMPVCHECALSAYYQSALDWHSDGKRVLGCWPEETE